VRAFGPAHAGIKQQADDRGVTPLREARSLARPEQPLELVVGQDLRRLFRHQRRRDVRHREGVDLLLGHGPLEKAVQRAVAVVRRRGLEPRQQIGGEGLAM